MEIWNGMKGGRFCIGRLQSLLELYGGFKFYRLLIVSIGPIHVVMFGLDFIKPFIVCSLGVHTKQWPEWHLESASSATVPGRMNPSSASFRNGSKVLLT